MVEGVLEREYVHAPLHSVCGMDVPQLVWVNLEPCGSAPLAANISNCLAREMPIPPGTREDELFIRAAAKSLKEAKRCWRYANSASLGSFAKEVNLASVIECLDVFPTDNRDLRDPASEQVRTFDQHVVALGLGVQVSGPRVACHQQPELLWGQRPGALLSVEKRSRWHQVARHPCDR
jgi:hypothetical protein